MLKTPLRALLLTLALLALAACSRHAEEVTPGGDTPQAAVADGYKLLRDNDIDGLYRHALPPADYAACARAGVRIAIRVSSRRPTARNSPR